MNEWTKGRFEVVVTSYGRNKNRDKKNKEKANNSLSYRYAAIKKLQCQNAALKPRTLSEKKKFGSNKQIRPTKKNESIGKII